MSAPTHPSLTAGPAYPASPPTAVGRMRAVLPSTDAFRMLVGALMVVTISRIHQHYGFLKPFRPALVLVGLAALYAVANPRMLVSGNLLRLWPTRLMAYLGGAACLSVPFGLSMGGSAAFILDEYSKTLIFGFLVVAAIRHVRDLYTMVWSYVIACAFLAWLSIFVYKMKIAKGDDFARIQTGYSYDSNDLGLVVLIGMVFSIMMLQVGSQKGKLFNLAMLASIGVTIAKTGSRGTLLGLATVVAVLLVLLENVSSAKKLGLVGIVSLGLVFAAPAGYWDQMLTIFAPADDYNLTSTTGRWQVWKRGMTYLGLNPITGIGIDNFSRAEGMYSPMAAARNFDPAMAGIKWSAAHNSFVQALVETGIIGGGIFVALVFGGIYQMFKLRRRMPKHWARGDPEQRFLVSMSSYMPAALIAFAVSGSLVSFAWIDPIYVLAALMSGLYVSVERKLAEEQGAGDAPGAEPVPVVLPRQGRGGLAHLPAGAVLPGQGFRTPPRRP